MPIPPLLLVHSLYFSIVKNTYSQRVKHGGCLRGIPAFTAPGARCTACLRTEPLERVLLINKLLGQGCRFVSDLRFSSKYTIFRLWLNLLEFVEEIKKRYIWWRPTQPYVNSFTDFLLSDYMIYLVLHVRQMGR